MLGRSISLGKLIGVEIKVHPTFALILLWVVYQWGFVAKAGVRGMIFGTLVLVTVFVCVLAHELAHAVVAMRNGLAVQDITLLPIGGVAKIEHATMTPRTETIVALAGPITNLIIAGALTPVVLLVAVVTSVNEALGYLMYAEQLSIIGFILYLWIANLVLAAFNLIPAFPMDGGRVLRAQLAAHYDRLRATQLAVFIGQILAFGLSILGIVTGNYVLLLIAIFILVYAQMESRHVHVESRLRMLPVGQFALWDTGGISPNATLALATRGGPRDLVVTDNGQVVGMLWRRDLLQHLNGAHHDIVVRDIMDRRFYPVSVNDSVYDVHLWLADTRGSAVPVVENGHYRGIFTGERLAHVYEAVGEQEWLRFREWGLALLHRLRLNWR